MTTWNIRDAVLSADRKHRFVLTRAASLDGPIMCFVMLNPSTADSMKDDQTVRKCMGFAKVNGFKAIRILNLWSYRTRDPKVLAAAGWPNHNTANHHIQHTLERLPRGSMVICAYGANVRKAPDDVAHKRMTELAEMLDRHWGGEVHALKLTADRIPMHPLTLPYKLKPFPFTPY